MAFGSRSVSSPNPPWMYVRPNKGNDGLGGLWAAAPFPDGASSSSHRGLECPHHGFFAGC